MNREFAGLCIYDSVDYGQYRKLIYVVDDEQVIAETLAVILERAGYAPKAFFNAEDALDAMRLEPPDLLLSDVVLPEMNGIELAEVMHRENPIVQVILFSGQAETSTLVEQARKRGFVANVYAKPLRPEALLRIISFLLRDN